MARSQAGAWERVRKRTCMYARTGRMPVLLNLSFWFFQQDFACMLMILQGN